LQGNGREAVGLQHGAALTCTSTCRSSTSPSPQRRSVPRSLPPWPAQYDHHQLHTTEQIQCLLRHTEMGTTRAVLQWEAARTAARSDRTRSRTAAHGTGRRAGKHAVRGGEQERDKVWVVRERSVGLGGKITVVGPS
jgi:hypothetical protein